MPAGLTRSAPTARNGPTRALGPSRTSTGARAGNLRTGPTTWPSPSRTTRSSPAAGTTGRCRTGAASPNPPAEAFPNAGYAHDEAWPEPQNTLTPAASPVGGNTGVPPSGASKNDAGHPVVGSVPAKTPKPYAPHTAEPEVFDPADTVEEWSDAAQSTSSTTSAKGAQHVTDANPVEYRHVYAVMESNFPDSALEWVKHSTWIGPVNVPWSRVDDDDIDSWAASHQPEAVQRFAKEIARGGRHTEPSILVHQANHSDGREKIIDGHHRAMARHLKLGKPVLAYVGTVPQRWMAQALETHSSQLHQGADPANKGDAETLREYWTHEAHGGPTDFAYADEIAWGTDGDFAARGRAAERARAHDRRAGQGLREPACTTGRSATGPRSTPAWKARANEARRVQGSLRPRMG